MIGFFASGRVVCMHRALLASSLTVVLSCPFRLCIYIIVCCAHGNVDFNHFRQYLNTLLQISAHRLRILIMSHLLKTDQDAAMPAAIHAVFPDTVHRLCLWHVLNKYKPILNELYSRFFKKRFKEKFESVIHHPLTVSEFESAWGMLMNEFELNADQTLQALYDIRAEWVPCFFKKDYCGMMTSTQRSESVNNIVKTCHVDENIPLHKFAKQMMRFIYRRKMAESRETYGCTVRSFFLNDLCVVFHICNFCAGVSTLLFGNVSTVLPCFHYCCIHQNYAIFCNKNLICPIYVIYTSSALVCIQTLTLLYALSIHHKNCIHPN